MPFEHLVGHIALEDTVNHILFEAGVEMYADAVKAIVWFTNPLQPELNQRVVYRRPQSVSDIKILICAWRETKGVVDLGKQIIPDVETIMCLMCGGAGWWEDRDGNQADCAACAGAGYVDVPLRDHLS